MAELEPNSGQRTTGTPVSFEEILTVLTNRIWWMAKVVGIATALTIVIVLVLPKSYKSSTTLLPESNQQSLSAMAGLSGLASLAGLNLAGSAVEPLYPEILTSEVVLSGVIYRKYQTEKFVDSVNLIQYWEIEEDSPEEDFESCLRSLREKLDIAFDRRLNTVTVELSDREPKMAAEILNSLTERLNWFIATKRSSNASEQRKWIEARKREVEGDLNRSEEILKRFREKNRRIVDSPELLLQQERLTRDVQINSTIFLELKKQYEIAKIEEIKNIPVVNVLDPARPAARKDKPKRTIITIVVFLLAVGGSIAYVLLDHLYRAEFLRLTAVVTRIFRK